MTTPFAPARPGATAAPVSATLCPDLRARLNEAMALIGTEDASRAVHLTPGVHTLVYALIQSGKFTAAQNVTLRALTETGCAVVVLTRCVSTDVAQQVRSVAKSNALIKRVMRERALCLPDGADARALSDPELLDALERPGSVLPIAIASVASLARLKRLLDPRPALHRRVIVIIDEADLFLLSDANLAAATQTETLMRWLVDGAYGVVRFTATAIPVFASALTQIRIMAPVQRPGRAYFGLDSVEHVALPTSDQRPLRASNGVRRIRAYDLTANKHNLVFFLAHLLARRAGHGWALGLVHVDRLRPVHHEVARFLHERFDADGLRIIVMNEGCLKLYARGGAPGTCERVIPVDADNTINTLLSELREGGEDLVVIVSGTMAGRSLNITDDSYAWYTTDMLYSTGDSTTGDNLMQAERLLGIFPADRPPPRLFCTPALWANLKAEFERHDRFVKECLANGIHTIDPAHMPEDTRRLLDLFGGHLPLRHLARKPVGPRRMKGLGLAAPVAAYSSFDRWTTMRRWAAGTEDMPLVNDWVDITERLPIVAAAVRRHCTSVPLGTAERHTVQDAVLEWLSNDYAGPFRLPPTPRIVIDQVRPNRKGVGGDGMRSRADLSVSIAQKRPPKDGAVTWPHLFRQDVYVCFDPATARVALSLLLLAPLTGDPAAVQRGILERPGDERVCEVAVATTGGGTVRLIERVNPQTGGARTDLAPGFRYHKADGAKAAQWALDPAIPTAPPFKEGWFYYRAAKRF